MTNLIKFFCTAFLATVTVIGCGKDDGGSGGGSNPTPTTVSGLSRACLAPRPEDAKTMKRLDQLIAQGFYPYTWPTQFMGYNTGSVPASGYNGYLPSGYGQNAMSQFCGCPTGYTPICDGTAGLVCAPQRGDFLMLWQLNSNRNGFAAYTIPNARAYGQNPILMHHNFANPGYGQMAGWGGHIGLGPAGPMGQMNWGGGFCSQFVGRTCAVNKNNSCGSQGECVPAGGWNTNDGVCAYRDLINPYGYGGYGY